MALSPTFKRDLVKILVRRVLKQSKENIQDKIDYLCFSLNVPYFWYKNICFMQSRINNENTRILRSTPPIPQIHQAEADALCALKKDFADVEARLSAGIAWTVREATDIPTVAAVLPEQLVSVMIEHLSDSGKEQLDGVPHLSFDRIKEIHKSSIFSYITEQLMINLLKDEGV